ncbi:hypothetical protein [Methanosarcina sp. DH2]|nr:hypothetical protein [Methanosarcina sp. DH2]
MSGKGSESGVSLSSGCGACRKINSSLQVSDLALNAGKPGLS